MKEIRESLTEFRDLWAWGSLESDFRKRGISLSDEKTGIGIFKTRTYNQHGIIDFATGWLESLDWIFRVQ
jgi:hypothetical protein